MKGKFIYGRDDSTEYWLFNIEEITKSYCIPLGHIFAYGDGGSYSVNVGLDSEVEFEGSFVAFNIYDSPQDLMDNLMTRLTTEMINTGYNPGPKSDSLVGSRVIENLDLEHTGEQFIHLCDIYDKWIFGFKSITPGGRYDWILKCDLLLSSQSNDDVNIESGTPWPTTLDRCIHKKVVAYNTAGELLKDVEMYLRYELEHYTGLAWR